MLKIISIAVFNHHSHVADIGVQQEIMEHATITQDIIKENTKEINEEELPNDTEFSEINKLYDECLTYLKQESLGENESNHDPDYESIEETNDPNVHNNNEVENNMVYKIENELISTESINTVTSEPRSERLRKLSQQLPKIIITQSNTSLNIRHDDVRISNVYGFKRNDAKKAEHKSLPKIDHKIYEFQQNNVKEDISAPRSIKLLKNRRDTAVVEKKIGNGKKNVVSEAM